MPQVGFVKTHHPTQGWRKCRAESKGCGHVLVSPMRWSSLPTALGPKRDSYIFLQWGFVTQMGRSAWDSSALCLVQKGTGSQVLGSWNEKVRADSSFYRVWEAPVAAVANCVVRAHSALTPSVLWGMCFGYLGALRCVLILVTNKKRFVLVSPMR